MNQPIVTEYQGSSKANYIKFAAKQVSNEYRLPILLVLLHLPLGILLYNAGSFGLIHPIVVFMIGMRHALIVEEKIERAAQVAVYIVGAEVLWRMAGIPIFWEFGKYGAALIMITALLKRGIQRIPSFAIFYFFILLPACFITLFRDTLSDAKDSISFNLSGPFFLMVSACFFSHLKTSEEEIRKLLLSIIIPLISVAVTTLFYTVTTTEIVFNGESNFATSGGFGPNQVSAMLGLGTFLCIAGFLLFNNSLKYSIFFCSFALLFLAQGVLTFSRGGVYNAVGGTLAIVFIQMRNLKVGIRRFIPVLGIFFVFLIIIFPYLNNFTGGALQDRFEDKEVSGRSEIVEADASLFSENPIFGVGVGNADEERGKFLNHRPAASHTEFSRMISEHGMFGILSIFALILMIIFNFRRHESDFGKAFVLGFAAWSALFMLNAGMRLAAPSLILGMIYLTKVNFKPQHQVILREKNTLI